MKRKLISAKDITKGFGVSYQTVNSYTDLGLLDVVSKKNHMRMYDHDEVKRRLLKISRLVNEGYTLRLIRRMIDENK
jgi:DNA-binding transcriptional MerR regulator